MYWGIIEILDVDTSGFLNLNNLFVAVVSWRIVVLIGMILAIFRKGFPLNGTVVVHAQAIFLMLSLFLSLIFAGFMAS